jgi:thiol-disulfide isomerase/thioredoxin
MMKKILISISLIILAGILASYLYVKASAASDGDEAPNFVAELVDGTKFQLTDLRGHYVLLNFWGSWCGPCRQDNPELVQLHEKFDDKLTIVTIALEKDGQAGKIEAVKDGFSWKHQIVEETSLVLLSSIARSYGVSEIPAKFLISPDGILLKQHSYKEIDQLLSKK